MTDKEQIVQLKAQIVVLNRKLDVAENDVKLLKLAARKLVAWVAVTTLRYGLKYPANFVENVLTALAWTTDDDQQEAA